MKPNPIILITLLLALIFFSCKKQEQETLTPKITNDKVETTATTATFTWTVDWPGKLISVVEVSENEDMSHSQTYGSETETENPNFTVTVPDLKEATRYYYRHIVWNKHYVDNKFEMEVKDFTTKADVPKVKTVEVTDVTRTTATVIGEVTDDCGAEVTERGVCWSTSHNPTTNGSHLNSGTGLGTYSVALTNLEVGKTYYVRAYAKNSKGTAYGDELDFVTGDAVKPTVITAEVTNIDWRTATSGGEVTDDGDATVTERGICWSTSHNPEMSGDHASNGTGIGSYTVNMTGLTAGTTYYVRAYAKNIAGLNYGDEVSFETKNLELPIVTTNSVTEISYTTAQGGGNVTSDGGAEVTERGICWGTSHNPDLGNGFSHLAASTVGTGEFVVDIDGLNAGTIYYVRAYAKNSVGVNYGEEKSFETTAFQKPTVSTSTVTDIDYQAATCGGNVTDDGGLTVTERGICWGISHNPDIGSGFSHLAASTAGTGIFTVIVTGLTDGTTYYVRAYAKNSLGVDYGEEKSFTTKTITKPTVETLSLTSLTSTTAVGGGNVTDDGGAEVIERGVCWGTSHDPNIGSGFYHVAASSTGMGNYTITMNGLTEGTTYYMRAYAINSKGTSYGEELSFVTPFTGATNGLFTVGSGKKVYFSQGNLQYQASTSTWRFATNQWDFVGGTDNNGSFYGNVSGSSNNYISSTYSGWIDLFGWGTSGWNSGAVCYQPWSTSQTNNDYRPGGSNSANLTGTYANADWGVYNTIFSGSTATTGWRTLTKDEWKYVFNTRQASMINGIANARYAKAKVINVQGVILFPDVYTHPDGVALPMSINDIGNTGWNGNNYSNSDWIKMEAAGAVFLPATGKRGGTLILDVELPYGHYWSASSYYHNSLYDAGVLYFGKDNLLYDSYGGRATGRSVRLVRDVQ